MFLHTNLLQMIVLTKIFDSLSSTLKQYLQRTSRIVDDFVKDSMEKMFEKANDFQEVLGGKKTI